jgi:hypothetical protein
MYVVHAHVVDVYGGVEVGLHSFTDFSTRRSEWSTSCFSRFTPGKGAHDTQRTGGSGGPRAGLVNLNEIKILLPMPRIEPRFLGREARSQVSGCMCRPKQTRGFSENIFQKLMFRYRHAWRSFAVMKTLDCANVLGLRSSLARLVTVLPCVVYCEVRWDNVYRWTFSYQGALQRSHYQPQALAQLCSLGLLLSSYFNVRRVRKIAKGDN